MQFPFIAIGALLLLLRTVSSSITILKPRSQLIDEYDCKGVLISRNKLLKVMNSAKFTYNFRYMLPNAKKLLSKTYDGPPFTKPFLLWEIPVEQKLFQKSRKSPYRAVLNEHYEVFSVIIKNEHNVEECKMKEVVSQAHVPLNFDCRGEIFSNKNLVKMIKAACPQIGVPLTRKFPARYNGDHYMNHGKQRYVFPISNKVPYVEGRDPGPYRVVMNSECKIIGATRYYRLEQFPCLIYKRPIP